jgi:uridine kinase
MADFKSAKHVHLVGIAGGTGSGKTTLAQFIVHELGEHQAKIVEMDAYYRDGSHLSLAIRQRLNFDHPDAIDVEMLKMHLDLLCVGIAVHKPVYDYARHTRTDKTVRVLATPIILVEGILTLAISEIRQRLNYGIYLDTPPEICLERRIRRDMAQRGRSRQSVLEQYQATVRPMYEAFVCPSRKWADLIFGWRDDPRTIISILNNFLNKIGTT